MKRIYRETLNQLTDRWTVLCNEINRNPDARYPGLLCLEVHLLIRRTERLVNLDPFEADAILTAKILAENCDLAMALSKLHEVLQKRLEGST
ncbi:hypothetical protein AWB81_04501 [Caballeronia arationis]|uniref:Uncharacterized protein n=1 Tax=Caballeronia arationis TaxID=1777142 RepID=A0A7Z7I1F0_9BURK|nr:hypothetical protein [Caballeronia arationis]SAK87158.1 hypothetical protein AWB81_04501 [Caballeronia arationis]SOE45644.1 hypothetical protein SAMN05446927_0042 [Caballeronia arationis]